MKAVVRAHGHPAVTATHHKTLEISTDAAITERATCVVAVGASYDGRELLALRGRVRATIACGDAAATFEAAVSPFFEGRGPLVFRRGPTLRGATFASDAGATAATLDRALVERLRDPDNTVEVAFETIDEEPSPPGVLFVACVAAGAELPDRARALDRVVDAAMVDPPGAWPDLEADRVGPDDLIECVRDGGRGLLVVAPHRERPADAAAVAARAFDAGAAVQAVNGGLFPETPLLAAGCSEAGYVLLRSLPRSATERRRVFRAVAAAGLPCLAVAGERRVAAALDELPRLTPEADVTATFGPGTVHEQLIRVDAATLPGPPAAKTGSDPAWLVLGPREPAVRSPFAAETRDLVQALRAQGVSERTLVLCLQEATGESRSAAYDLVRGAGAEPPATPR